MVPMRSDWDVATKKEYLDALGCDMPSVLETRTLARH